MSRWGRDIILPKNLTPSIAPSNQEGAHHSKISPWGMRGLRPTLRTQFLGHAVERQAPKMSGFENYRAHIQEVSSAIGNCDTSLSGLSFALEISAKAAVWKEPKLYTKNIYLIILKHLPQEQGSVGTLWIQTLVSAIFALSPHCDIASGHAPTLCSSWSLESEKVCPSTVPPQKPASAPWVCTLPLPH